MDNINTTNIIGQRFGSVVAIKRTGIMNFKSGQRHSLWEFKCDCGETFISRLNNIKRKKYKDCGKCTNPDPHTKLMYGESSLKALYDSYIRRAKYADLNFNLNIEEFKKITSMNCHYCGIEPSQKKFANKLSYGHYLYNGVDRLDSTKGYLTSNVVPCCKTCNFAKRDLSYGDFINWLKRAYEYLNSTT